MAIKFKVVNRKKPGVKDDPGKFYPHIVGDGKTNLNDLAKYASEISTVSKGDILAVLETVFTKIADDVADGKIVYVGDYFTLQAGGTSSGSDTPEEVTAHNIKKAKTIFRAGKLIKDALKLSTFEKMK